MAQHCGNSADCLNPNQNSKTVLKLRLCNILFKNPVTVLRKLAKGPGIEPVMHARSGLLPQPLYLWAWRPYRHSVLVFPVFVCVPSFQLSFHHPWLARVPKRQSSMPPHSSVSSLLKMPAAMIGCRGGLRSTWCGTSTYMLNVTWWLWNNIF